MSSLPIPSGLVLVPAGGAPGAAFGPAAVAGTLTSGEGSPQSFGSALSEVIKKTSKASQDNDSKENTASSSGGNPAPDSNGQVAAPNGVSAQSAPSTGLSLRPPVVLQDGVATATALAGSDPGDTSADPGAQWLSAGKDLPLQGQSLPPANEYGEALPPGVDPGDAPMSTDDADPVATLAVHLKRPDDADGLDGDRSGGVPVVGPAVPAADGAAVAAAAAVLMPAVAGAPPAGETPPEGDAPTATLLRDNSIPAAGVPGLRDAVAIPVADADAASRGAEPSLQLLPGVSPPTAEGAPAATGRPAPIAASAIVAAPVVPAAGDTTSQQQPIPAQASQGEGHRQSVGPGVATPMAQARESILPPVAARTAATGQVPAAADDGLPASARVVMPAPNLAPDDASAPGDRIAALVSGAGDATAAGQGRPAELQQQAVSRPASTTAPANPAVLRSGADVTVMAAADAPLGDAGVALAGTGVRPAAAPGRLRSHEDDPLPVAETVSADPKAVMAAVAAQIGVVDGAIPADGADAGALAPASFDRRATGAGPIEGALTRTAIAQPQQHAPVDTLLQLPPSGLAANLVVPGTGGAPDSPDDPGSPQEWLRAIGSERLLMPQAQHLPFSATPLSGADVAQPVPSAPAPLSLFAPAAGADSWGEEIGQRILWMTGRALKSAHIQLDPPELGPLQVRVSNEGGATSIHFTTHSAAVRDIVEQSLPRLRDMLASSGTQLVDVNVAHQQNRGEQSARDPGWAGRGGAMTSVELDEGFVTATSPVRVPLGLVDQFV